MKYLNKRIVLVLVIPVLAVAIVFASIRKTEKALPAKEVQEKKIASKIDSGDVELLKSLALSLNPVGANYSLSGQITIKDGADSISLKENYLKCISIKRGNDFYYRLGETETLREGSINICIDNEGKKVILYKTDRLEIPPTPVNTAKLIEYITGEGYKLIRTASLDKKSKISLINPYHISCKEFSVTFGTENLKPLSFYSRLCNDVDPSNPKLDKEITFVLDAALPDEKELLSASRVLIKKGKDGFVLTGRYKQFELVIMS